MSHRLPRLQGRSVLLRAAGSLLIAFPAFALQATDGPPGAVEGRVWVDDDHDGLQGGAAARSPERRWSITARSKWRPAAR